MLAEGSGSARRRATRCPPLQRIDRQGRHHAGQSRQRQDRQADILIGTIKADQSALGQSEGPEKLHHDPARRSPDGSARPTSKVGNFVRPADTAPLAVINQMAPVYVAFAIPQRVLVDLREAMAAGDS